MSIMEEVKSLVNKEKKGNSLFDKLAKTSKGGIIIVKKGAKPHE